MYTARRNLAMCLTICFKDICAKYSHLSFTNSTFHKTLEHNSPGSLHLITSWPFLQCPIMFFLSTWDLTMSTVLLPKASSGESRLSPTWLQNSSSLSWFLYNRTSSPMSKAVWVCQGWHTKYRFLEGFNNRDLHSYSSRGKKSETKVSAALVSFEAALLSLGMTFSFCLQVFILCVFMPVSTFPPYL